MSPSVDPDTIGPVDVALFVFEDDSFNGDIAPSLAELHQNGTVNIIDLAFIRKDADGAVTVVEVEEDDAPEPFANLADDQFDLLSDEDLLFLGNSLEPGTAALAVVWDNTWAARFAAAIRNSGGTLATLQRIPREDVMTAIAALSDDES